MSAPAPHSTPPPSPRAANTRAPDPAPADQFCDLVMNGGITSGVVFPQAVAELAKRYRFHSIAGTSAGAMAAAITAAAEYGRRRSNSDQGFEALAELSRQFGDDLSSQLPGQRGPMTRLRTLFQPQAATRRLFELLLAALGPGTPGPHPLGQRLRSVLLAAVRLYVLAVLLGAGLGVGVAVVIGWAMGGRSACALGFAALLPALIGAALALAWALWRDVARGLVPNGLGLCNGMPGDAASGQAEALVPWLHSSIQRLAGRRLDEAPLSFADLHAAPGYPPPWRAPSVAAPDKSIVLKMVTTNLSHGRPYVLPLQDETTRLFFDPAELAPYFPAPVMAHLVAHAKAYAPKSAAEPGLGEPPQGLLELPGDALPLVVAARLSLSFPLLFSAVPLWAIDAERGATDAAHPLPPQRLRRCWFSDGGISANFPIHLFDSAVPQWPTFGIQLTALRTDRLDAERTQAQGMAAGTSPSDTTPRDTSPRVWLPQHHLQGMADRWIGITAKDASPATVLGRYLWSIFLAAKDWRDNTLARMPGVRDRVVQVALDERQEGGLNLNMPREHVDHLVALGEQAGAQLIGKFAPRVSGDALTGGLRREPAPGWDEHRWVRMNSYVLALRHSLDRLGAALAGSRHASASADQIAQALVRAPLSGDPEGDPVGDPVGDRAGALAAAAAAGSAMLRTQESTLSPAQAGALLQALRALQEAERALAATAAVAPPYRPQPAPQLRSGPPL